MVLVFFGSILLNKFVRPRAKVAYTITFEIFSGWHGYEQDLDIRTHLAERNSKIYNMSMIWEKNFVRPNVGVP